MTMTRWRVLGISLAALVTAGGTLVAQDISSQTVFYLKNKQSGKLLDVRGASDLPGAQIWQYPLNYTKAQTFRIILQGDASAATYTIRPQVSDHYLSLKRSLPVADSPAPRSPIIGDLPLAVRGDTASTAQPATSSFIVIQDRKYEADPMHAASLMASRPDHQRWKFVPVANEPHTYYIRSVAFTENIVLQPINSEAGAALKVAPYTSETIQKWELRPTIPAAPTDLSLSEFTWKTHWFSGKIRGTLKWKDQSSNEDGFEILVSREEPNGYFSAPWSLGRTTPNKTSYAFSDGSEHGKGRQHCFRVRAYNRWGTAASTDVCAIPSTPTPPPPQPPPVTGVSTVAVYNCHSAQKSVKVWSLDLTAGTGAWVDRGTLASQWTDTSCPGNAAPLKFPLTDGHSFSIIAIDCGSAPPNETQSSCYKLQTTSAIPGMTNGITLVLTVQ